MKVKLVLVFVVLHVVLCFAEPQENQLEVNGRNYRIRRAIPEAAKLAKNRKIVVKMKNRRADGNETNQEGSANNGASASDSPVADKLSKDRHTEVHLPALVGGHGNSGDDSDKPKDKPEDKPAENARARRALPDANKYENKNTEMFLPTILAADKHRSKN